MNGRDMEGFKKGDKIRKEESRIYHESAGGFVFFEDPATRKLSVALIQPEGSDKFFIPKGHMSDGESPREAALREIREELSLSVSPEYVCDLGTEEYSFTLDDSGDVHFKKVYLFVYSIHEKVKLAPPKNEGIREALWVDFYDALNDMAFNRDNLLRARQLYDFNKKVR